MIYINNEEKLNRIKKEKDFYVITDFDRTLTTKSSEPSMGIVPEFLGGECLEKRLKIFNKYRPIELDYTLDKAEKEKCMKEWAKASFTLLSNYLTEEIVDKSLVNAKLYLRDGAKEFLQYINNQNNTVVIMSSGVGNVVESFLRKEDCIFDNTYIVSNFFQFINKRATINLENIMATANKEYKRIPSKIKHKIENSKYGLLFGDLVEDLKMANNLENVLTFGFLDENIEKNLEEFNKKFDIVLTKNGNFNDIQNILQTKERKK